MNDAKIPDLSSPGRLTVRVRVGAALLLALAPMLALAQPRPAPEQSLPESETLRRIVETGTISLGHRESSVPFSYYDGRKRVVDSLKAELKLPALTLRLVPLTTQNRIPLVRNGTVDLECASTTHTADRARQVAFSTTFFIAGTRLLVRRGSPIRDFSDLAGRSAVVTAGTTSERLLRTHVERRRLEVRIVTVRDHEEAFLALESGRAEAFMMDDALLYGARARAVRPGDWEVVGTPMSQEAYACMMRRGDPEFKAAVDRALVRLMQSGEAMRTYQRWFQEPIPPWGLNLNWPPSPAMLQLQRSPNDRPLG